MKTAAFCTLATAIGLFSSRAHATDFTVTNTVDGGVGSLRRAINDVNKAAPTSNHRIVFKIPASRAVNGVYVIRLNTQLPSLATDNVVINGNSQTNFTGDTNPAGPEIQVMAAAQLPDGPSGLTITGDHCTVRGLALGNFSGPGISFGAVTGGAVTGCHIGLGARGESLPNVQAGVLLDGAKDVSIGLGSTEPVVQGARTLSANSNIISGNFGFGVAVYNGFNIWVRGNRIGTGRGGGQRRGNNDGVSFTDSFSCGLQGNLVSGNSFTGVNIERTTATVTNNFIGTDAAGQNALGNGGAGIYAHFGSVLKLGQHNKTSNIISGNTDYGVILSGAQSSELTGNYIGLAADGVKLLSNNAGGIFINNADGDAASNKIGVPGAAPNVIVGNGPNNSNSAQIRVDGEFTQETSIVGNLIGVLADGLTLPAVNNRNYGIVLAGGTSKCQIGAPGARNIIGGCLKGINIIDAKTASNKIQSNSIGIGRDNRTPIKNEIGIAVESDSNFIGGTGAGEGNVISGNYTALTIADSPTARAPKSNLVQGNFIGTDRLGTTKIPNYSGIVLYGNQNTVGGTGAARNIISGNRYTAVTMSNDNTLAGNVIGLSLESKPMGNGVDGVFLQPSETASRGEVRDNVIAANGRHGILAQTAQGTRKLNSYLLESNFIGTNRKGKTGLGNAGDGVRVENFPGILIGGETGNTIGGNAGAGIRLTGPETAACEVNGNGIGVDLGTKNSLLNGSWGIVIEGGAHDNLLALSGTDYPRASGKPNLIGSNRQGGILIQDGATTRNELGRNYIGVLANGTPIPNFGPGIRIENSAGNLIGRAGTAADGGGCSIGGNLGPGILLTGSQTTGNLIAGNYIGHAEIAGHAISFPNQLDGIVVEAGANANYIGSLLSGGGNQIGGNRGAGVLVSGSQTTRNVIQNNQIGFLNAGNEGAGVLISGARQTNVGASLERVTGFNTIAYNDGGGIVVEGSTAAANVFLSNSISANTGLGIDLVGGQEDGFGVTANDAGDTDSGPNGLQNAPRLVSVTPNSEPDGVTINGELDSLPNQSGHLEIFAIAKPDASGHGEGRRLLARLLVQTDATGHGAFVFNTTIQEGENAYSAIATLQSQSSEFSNALSIPAPVKAGKSGGSS